MENYQDKPLLSMPFPKGTSYQSMTDEELTDVLQNMKNYNVLIPALIEMLFRRNKEISELNRRLRILEEKEIKKPGRKKQIFYHNGKELTDEELVYLVDYEYYDSIRKLEREVGAGKNQLRNRYNKAKRREKIESEAK